MRILIVILRTSRTFKLVNKWKSLGNMLTFIWNAISDIANFAVLLAIVVFMFAVIGMELFAEQVKFNAEDKKDLIHGVSDRMHYDDLGNALRSVFALLVGDNWTTTFYLYNRFNKASATVFFLCAFFVINILMLNLFVAIILENISEDEQKKRLEVEERSNQEYWESKKSKRGSVSKTEAAGAGGKDGTSYRGVMEQYKHRERTLLGALKIFKRLVALEKEVKAKRKLNRERMLYGRSFMIFDTDSKLRLCLHTIVDTFVYQTVLYIVMFAYCILLSFHTPLYDPNGGLRRAITVVDIVTAAFFSLDALCKAVAFGLVANGEKSYLRSGWNVLDLILTIMQIVNLGLPESYANVRKVLYMCSVLRIAKVVTMREGFRLCIQAVINGAFRILQALFIAILFFIIFAIIGVQFFGGYLFYCDRTNLGSEVEIKSIYDCMNLGGEWRDRDVSFNNVFSAILTLFELFTGKSLFNLYRYLPDITDIDLEPVRDSEPTYTLFIVAFMIVGFIFIRAVVTGVISDTFFKEKDILQGFRDLTPAQIKWAKLANIMFKAHPEKMYPREAALHPLHRFLTHSLFHLLISIVLVLNGVAMALTWHRVDAEIDHVHGLTLAFMTSE